MNKVNLVLIMFVFFSLSLTGEFIEISSSSVSNLDLRVDLPEAVFSTTLLPDNNLYDRIIIPGSAQHLPGLPDIPAFGNWILIPNGTDVNISVTPGTPVYFDNINIAPVQHQKADLVDAQDPEFILNNEVFGVNTDFPGYYAEIESVKKKRGQECTILWIYPYQYNPVKQQLIYYPELQISVGFNGIVEPFPTNLYREEYRGLLTGMAINAVEVLEAEGYSTAENPDPLRDEGCDLLIITHPLFDEAAQNLATWKRQKAIRTKVVSLDETGYETQEIDDYINNVVSVWDPAPMYLLLIGDSEFLPTWYVTEHPYDNGQGYTAADVYYADIDVPHDLIADLSFGRIPVESPAQATDYINKIIQYEQNPPEQSDFYNNMICAAYFQDAGGGYAERRFAKTSEDVRNFLTENYYDVTRIYYTESDTNPLYWNVSDYVFENDTAGGPLPDEIRKPQFAWAGSANDINQAINIGTYFILHRDHGYRLGWGDPAYSVYNMSGLANGNLLPVVWTINCNTGWFDNETDDQSCGTAYDSESFVEDFINQENGGTVGLIGATRVSYSGNNDRIVWGFMNAIWPEFLDWCTADYPDHDPIYKMGDVINYGKEYFMANTTWGGDVRVTTLEQFLWFGDPTTEMWTSQPQELTAEFEVDIALGSSEYTISCDIENADVALILDDKVISKGTINGGSVTLEFPPIIGMGNLLLGVSAHNYIPFVTEINIIPTGPYVICESVEFHEAGENLDGSIQALDIVDIDLNLNNIGIEATADEILITLHTESGFVEILDDNVTASIIDDSTSLIVENAFSIMLDPGMQSGEIIDFTMTMQSGESTWPGSFQLQVQAPFLEFLGYTLNHEDGNDGILDPGESVQISVNYLNSGDGFSYDVFTTLTTNDPYVQISGMDMIDQIDPGAETSSSYPLTISVSPDCPVDYFIELSLLAFDNAGSVLIRDFSIPIGLLVFNFDDGSGIWENENLEEGYLNEWHLSGYRNFTLTGEYSMKCGGTDDAFYSNDLFAALYTPHFQSVPGTYIRFTHWMNTGIIGGTQSWDGGKLEISVNGDEFVPLEPVGGYPVNIINLDIFPFDGGTPVFAGTIDWEEVEADLSEYSGSVQVRFVFGSSPTMYTMEGWYIDDVQIVNYTDSDENEIIPSTTSLSQNSPNPFNPETKINFAIAEKSSVLLEIYNIRGQKIRTLINEIKEPGLYDMIWNGDDDYGSPAASGIYFYKLNTLNFSDVRKMILMK